MSDSQPAQAGADTAAEYSIPTYEELAADPEIAALLNFEPAPRQNKRKNGWTEPLQKMFIAHLARTGSPGLAADAVGKSRFGVEKLCKGEGAESFSAAWDGAVALFEERDARRREAVFAGTAGSRPPFVDRRRRPGEHPDGPRPGQVRNEHGEYEDEAYYHRRADEARDSISAKILNARRLYLKEISASPGKRAAFEILTEYPIDWDRAERLQAQDDEPFRKPNMHRPDMLLTAENGWLGDFAHGPDKKAELRKALDEHRAKEGKPPVDWEGE